MVGGRQSVSLLRLLVLLIAIAACVTRAADAPRKAFDIPAGAAEQSLKVFSEQSRMEVLVPTTTVKDVRTRQVRGEMTVREALDRMLRDTGLVGLPDEKTGVVTVRRETPVTHGGTNGAHALPATASERPGPGDSRAGVGAVVGRVFNGSTGAALAKVRVSVLGTSLETTTDESGSYQLGGLPAGDLQLRVAYLGLLAQTATMSVPAGGSVQMDFELVRTEQEGTRKAGEIVRLTEFNVIAEREMSAQDVAVNEQRHAPNIKNVVALGEFGDRGSENIGEFLRFLPGVSILNSGEEADTLSLRGIPANHTGVMMDGAQIATGGDNTRTLTLRAISRTSPSPSTRSLALVDRELDPEVQSWGLTFALNPVRPERMPNTTARVVLEQSAPLKLLFARATEARGKRVLRGLYLQMIGRTSVRLDQRSELIAFYRTPESDDERAVVWPALAAAPAALPLAWEALAGSEALREAAWRFTVRASEVAQRHKLAQSVMPANYALFGDQAIGDLTAFLLGLRR